jgi:NADH-ubiquinone oxidoreductase chain 5
MFLTIIFLPLVGSVISGFMGRKIGITGSHLITCSCLIMSSLLSTIGFYFIGICNDPIYINLGN